MLYYIQTYIVKKLHKLIFLIDPEEKRKAEQLEECYSLCYDIAVGKIDNIKEAQLETYSALY